MQRYGHPANPQNGACPALAGVQTIVANAAVV
jgi:hypothetical protein